MCGLFLEITIFKKYDSNFVSSIYATKKNRRNKKWDSDKIRQWKYMIKLKIRKEKYKKMRESRREWMNKNEVRIRWKNVRKFMLKN